MNTTECLNNPEAMKVVRNVMSEVIDAANAHDYQFDHDAEMRTMIARTEATAQNYKPSM